MRLFEPNPFHIFGNIFLNLFIIHELLFLGKVHIQMNRKHAETYCFVLFLGKKSNILQNMTVTILPLNY
jgi:hypothetical protein